MVPWSDPTAEQSGSVPCGRVTFHCVTFVAPVCKQPLSACTSTKTERTAAYLRSLPALTITSSCKPARRLWLRATVKRLVCDQVMENMCSQGCLCGSLCKHGGSHGGPGHFPLLIHTLGNSTSFASSPLSAHSSSLLSHGLHNSLLSPLVDSLNCCRSLCVTD